MNTHTLSLLDWTRVTGLIAGQARTERGVRAVGALLPLPPTERATEVARLHEAMKLEAEQAEWCAAAPGDPAALLDSDAPLEGPALVVIGLWIGAARETQALWEAERRERFSSLAALVTALPDLGALHTLLTRSLDGDGRVRDDASPELKRARAAVAGGERELERRIEKWSRGFGEGAYVTRFGERFVAMVPAAGFPRSRGIVHDVSGSGHSLLVEPGEMCEDNNRLAEMRALAVEEERRILVALARAVVDEGPRLIALEETLVRLDTLRARARWGEARGGRAILPGGDRLSLRSAQHPLLAASGRAVVPLDLELVSEKRLLIVSGPNMGGKTVLLKTVGLATLMAHAALPVLAGEGSRIPELDRVEADLGDEQSLDQGLSTFAAHLRSLGAMAEAAGPRTLLLADELGAGTDPEEGAALAQALVEHFAARGAWGIVTTHLGSLKRLAGMIPSGAASSSSGIMNGSLGILPENLAPTYRFVPDVPGASHAISVAERLGLEASLIGRARELVRSEVIRIEELLLELQGLNARLEAERAAFAAAREEAERQSAEHARGLEAVRQEWEQVTRRLTRESDALTARARELWQSAQRESKKAAKDPGAASRIGEALSAVEAETERLMRAGLEAAGPLGIERPATDRLEPTDVVPGLKVHVANIGVEAEVESSPEPDGRVRLRRGGWSIQSHVRELRRLADAPAAPAVKNGPAASYEPSEETALEVDLRGMEVDEALRALDHALDRGVVGGLGEIRIIHGIGRGVLKRAVEKHLGHHPQVGSLRMGQLGEGGRGVSVARLR